MLPGKHHLIYTVCIQFFFFAAVFGQTSVSYDLVPENIEISPFPAIVGGIIPPTDYSQVSKPLVAEPFADDAGFFQVGSEIRPAAGAVGPGFFGGEGPNNTLGAIATCVMSTATFSEADFPIRLSCDFYAETLNPRDNEHYLFLVPTDYTNFGAPTYFYQNNTVPQEGILVGGYPTFTYVADHNSETVGTTVLSALTHNIEDTQQWFRFSAVFDIQNGNLIISNVKINDACVYDDEVQNVGPKAWLNNFRVGFAIDDLAANFRIETQVSELSATFTLPDMICATDCITPVISSSTGSSDCESDPPTYSWTFEGGTPATATGPDPGEVCFAEAGTFDVTLTAIANNTSVSSTQTITVNTPPVFSLGADTTICQGESLILQSDISGATYAWSTGETTAGITVAAAGSYALTLTDNGCSAADTLLVTYPDDMGNIDLGPDTLICQGSTITIGAAMSADSYLWSTGDTTAVISVSTPGAYVLNATFSECANTVSDTITVAFLDAPGSLQLSSDTLLCQGSTLSLSASGNADTYQWSTGANTPTISVDTSGTYAVTGFFSPCGTSQSDSLNVNFVFGETGVTLGADTLICQGDPVTLASAIAADSYNWSTGDTTASIVVSEAGSYVLTATIDACTDSDTLLIGYPDGAGSIDLGADRLFCADETVTLGETLPFATSYQWSTGDTTATIEVATTGTYSVTVSTDSECAELIDTVRVQTLPTQIPWQPAERITLCFGDSTVILVPDIDGADVRWSDGDTTLQYPINTSGFYGVTINTECAAADFRFQVSQEVCCLLNYPNAFSPNRDGLNDRFRPYYSPLTCDGLIAYRFDVWTRWGEHVYETISVDTGWDGTIRGQLAATGVYVWVATYLVGTETVTQSGSVTLMR